MSVAIAEERKDQSKLEKGPSNRPQEPYAEPQPIIDATSDFEQMDRGEGWGVDDEPTYHRTEK
jgi:hypothetical protein